MSDLNLGATGTSPTFAIAAEEFVRHYLARVTRVAIDGVEPPTQGEGGGMSEALRLVNQWSPWIDEKIIPPKFDGVCQYLGVVSNRPTHMRDYHWIALMKAVDYLLAPRYSGLIISKVDTVIPAPPPTG